MRPVPVNPMIHTTDFDNNQLSKHFSTSSDSISGLDHKEARHRAGTGIPERGRPRCGPASTASQHVPCLHPSACIFHQGPDDFRVTDSEVHVKQFL